jgi:hypothetical protein
MEFFMILITAQEMELGVYTDIGKTMAIENFIKNKR